MQVDVLRDCVLLCIDVTRIVRISKDNALVRMTIVRYDDLSRASRLTISEQYRQFIVIHDYDDDDDNADDSLLG